MIEILSLQELPEDQQSGTAFAAKSCCTCGCCKQQ